MTRVKDTLFDDMVQAIVDEVDPEQVILFGSRGRCGRARCSISDVKCARILHRVAEHDITVLRFMGGSNEYTPYAVEFRYQGVGPDAEAIDREETQRLVDTLWGQVGRAIEEAEGG